MPYLKFLKNNYNSTHNNNKMEEIYCLNAFDNFLPVDELGFK